jgi:hypothetical protein
MEALELLEQLRGKKLDAVQFELLRQMLETQCSTMVELETANLALIRRNDELHERLRRFEAQSARVRSAAHELREDPTAIDWQKKPYAR